jgi:hypothetical protein
MKIKQWLGYNEDASQYLLRPGELRVLTNLQARRPGMLIARRGLMKIYGKYDDESILGLYRRATPLGNPSDFLWLQKTLVARLLTDDELLAGAEPFEEHWIVRRVLGYQSRVIDTQPLSPSGLSRIENFCVSEDRHGRLFVFYGHGARPRLYRPDNIANACVDMGLDPPKVAPGIAPSGTGYYIEGVDVQSGGGAYYGPPELTISGGNPDRPAKLKAIIQNGNVVGVEVVDGGSNYQSPPTITASADKIGSGFRARGNISTSAVTVQGFSITEPGSVSGLAPSSTETYGINDGTDNNYILYKQPDAVLVEKVLTQTTANVSYLALGSVAGIAVGDTVTLSPSVVPFSTKTISVASINTTLNRVEVCEVVGSTSTSQPWTAAAGVAYTATFTRPGVAKAAAEYDPESKRFFATIPLRVQSSGSGGAPGSGATATLEFSPVPIGYGISSSSVSVIATNWMKYKNYDKSMVPFLYQQYWEGSDYDKQNSAANANYAGLQASGSSYVLGYSGAIGNKRADVYWPDYSKISVWFNTGTSAVNRGEWTRADIAVTTEGTGNSQAKVLSFQLRPAATAKVTTVVNGALVTSQYKNAAANPDAVPPTVKLYLTDCPDAWIVSDAQNRPTYIKEGQPDRLPWWSPSSGTPRPIVDIVPLGQSVSSAAVNIVDAGSGWAKGTKFSFRIYMGNPYDQFVDYNTASVEPTIAKSHPSYDGPTSTRYCEFTCGATTPDKSPKHGPPNTLITPCVLSSPGDGYPATTTGVVALLKRNVGATTPIDPAAVTSKGQSITWTSKTLDTLSMSSVNGIASVTVLSTGRKYVGKPTIEVRSTGNGYGLEVDPIVVDGSITGVNITNPGAGYTTPPELFTSAKAAQVTPKMRPAMRGKYRCAYRFCDMTDTVVATVALRAGVNGSKTALRGVESELDSLKPGYVLDHPLLPTSVRIKSINGAWLETSHELTALYAAIDAGTQQPGTYMSVVVRDMTKPVAYSDFSPITDIDAGPNDERSHCSALQWALQGVRPPPRCDRVELWRTSADQSLVFYRTDVYGIPTSEAVTVTGVDTLTDDQLFDANRAHYAAMPVVLPNGNLNAYRFGFPRSDMSVAVAFQDRLWMGVSTSGKDVNTLYYSEYDEFESVPDANDLPIQNNQKSTDVLTALVPFGSMLLAMQNNHTYAVSYNTDPSIDASIQMMSHRGCLHQRCWDIHENVLYAVDESGIYGLSRGGEVKELSMPIRDFFVSELLDYTKRERFFLQVDPKTHILRFFCVLTTSDTDTPALALCYDIQAGTWWTEAYPNSLTAACTGRPAAARVSSVLLGGVDGNLYEIASDSDHCNEGLTDTFVTTGGRGYDEAPAITVPNCPGASVQGVVSEGRLVDVIIHHPGWNANWGIGLICEDGAGLLAEDARPLQCIEYDAIQLDVAPPPSGGTQALAYANFGVTPLIVRDCTVSLGESFVRLKEYNAQALETDVETLINDELAAPLLTEDGRYLRTESPMVEIGMEAIGDYIPLNAFVSRLDGGDIYLSHPDGTPAKVLFGAARTNEEGTAPDYLEEGGTLTTVRFIKPYRTNIPFRMATGVMTLANETNTRNGDSLIDRSVTVVYTPTDGDKDVEIIERFNGRAEMRPNAMRRGRTGPGGFQHRQDSASTVLNMSREASDLGFSTGVATAKFASRVYTDLGGADQHLQVELYGRPSQASPWKRTNFWIADEEIPSPHPCVLHNLVVNGVVEDGE